MFFLILQYLNAVNFCVKKRIHNPYQIRGEKTQRQQDSLKLDKFVNFRMKWVVLPYSEPYTEEKMQEI